MFTRDQPHGSTGRNCYSLNSSHGSSGEVASIENTSTATFHGWKYKHYFILLSENDKNLKVRYTLCSGNKTLVCKEYNF